MNQRALCVQDVIDALTALNQPYATVHVTGEAVCDDPDHGDGYANVEFQQPVVHVRSRHPTLVVLEVKE